MWQQKVAKRENFFGNLLPGTFVNQTFCKRSPMGRRARKVFFSCTYGRYQPLTVQVTPRFFGAPTRKIVGRGRRTPNSISHHLEHGLHFCCVICDLCFMISVGGAWPGMATPQSVEIVAGVCRSCRVKIVLWANNQVYFQEGKSSENRLDENQRHRARCSSLRTE